MMEARRAKLESVRGVRQLVRRAFMPANPVDDKRVVMGTIYPDVKARRGTWRN